MALVTNPSTANKLALALKSGRRQIGSNGDGNATVANSEGQGLEPTPSGQPRNSNPLISLKKGPIGYPSNHQPGMSVPRGGSSCANCKFLGEDNASCMSPFFVKWNGSSALPAPPDEYCSDWWEPKADQSTPPGFAAVSRPGTLGGMNPGSQPAGANSNGPLQAPRTTLRSPGSV